MYQELIEQARAARKYAYAPYSHFYVGAALLSTTGKVYLGCNVENASYGGTNCAERTAFYKAISEGERKFRAIAIVGGYDETDGPGDETQPMCAPCGICRQVMMEFCDIETFQIILEKEDGGEHIYTLDELLPHGFGAANIGKG